MENATSKAPAWLVVLGILFMLLWLGGAFVLGAMKLMASVMANDSGSASADSHLGMIAAVMGGQVISGLAGIPGGLAFFSPGKRKKFWGIFFAMLVVGVLVQAAALYLFFS
ncbi:MAG: hypothetical protein ACK5TH_06480 [Prosthecobacter sp.]|jgi:hypothetical protein